MQCFRNRPGTAVKLSIPVVPEAARHIDFLTVPGYAALALENNGLHPSLSSRLIVKDRESFRIRTAVVRYQGKQGAVYSYDAGVNFSLGIGETELTLPVEVDTSGIAAGTLVVRIYPPLATLLPHEFVARVELKARLLADFESQRKLIGYLNRLAKEQQAKGAGFEGNARGDCARGL